MEEQKTIDARGLSCPQPPMLARQALQKMNKGVLEVIVDNNTARENVSRMARNLGWEVSIEEQPEGNFRIVMKK